MKPTLKCHRPWTGFEIVDHLGDVRPCCWGKKSCGNINDQKPEEIWAGGGFEYYREKMAQGNTEEICQASCPILQGHYVEIREAPSSAEAQTSFEVPLYLRVVPTTSCNLRCPMCYQTDAPPARLPENLFTLLTPWISTAHEFQILGGETFLTRQCLDWIRQISPSEFPNCKLATITNGLGFSEDVCNLIRERQWSWILVSIDACSPQAYARVRGGDFSALLRNLDRLAGVRACATHPFEIRFGFTLQLSNLHDAVGFLDLCAEYAAMPQYTVVFGDWHSEGPSSVEDFRRFYATLEELDKRLWQRGFGSQMLASSMAALRERENTISKRGNAAEGTTKTLQVVPNSGNGGGAGSILKLRVSEDLNPPRIARLNQRMLSSRKRGKETRLVISVDEAIAQETVEEALRSIRVQEFSIKVPFFARKEAVSALWVYPVIDSVLQLGRELGWNLVPEPLELKALGLEESNCDLEYETVFESGERKDYALSVVTPVYNCERFIESFSQSLFSQETDEEIEIVVVDDGSTDQSSGKLMGAMSQFEPRARLLLLRRKRKIPYRPQTFTFSAGLAREIGWRQSRGARILFLDPDQIVVPGCIQEHLDWGGRGRDVVIGDRRTGGLDVLTSWSRLRAAALSGQRDWWLSFFTGNASVIRHLLEEAGGFDCTLQYWGLDDTDLGYRLYRLGSSVWHTPRAVVMDLASTSSGGGRTPEERRESFRLHMEVLYRKYLDPEILDAFRFVWPESLNENDNGRV